MLKTLWLCVMAGCFSLWGYAGPTEFPVCIEAGDQSYPAVDGAIVVWQDDRNGNNDIYGYNLATRTEFPICTQADSQSSPAISGSVVVWQDSRHGNLDIYGYDLSTQTEFPICTQADSQYTPDVDGDIVVWRDARSGNNDIYAYDFTSRQEIVICGRSDSQYDPAVAGGIIVWRDSRNGGSNSDIYAYDRVTQKEFAVCTAAGNQYNPAISGDIVVWSDNRDSTEDIYSYHLETKTETPICRLGSNQYNPSVDGEMIVWEDYRNGGRDLYGYNLHIQSEFTICTHPALQSTPAVSGDVVVWKDDRDEETGTGIYAVSVDRRPFDSSDSCQNGAFVTEDVPFWGTTLWATGSDISSCAYNDRYDAWNRYIPAQGGTVTITTDGSTFDTVLSVYEACGGAELACNDDYGVDNPHSQVVMDVVKGKTYYIRVAGFNGEVGDYDLLITHGQCSDRPQSDINDDCKVNLLDCAILAAEWLTCGYTNPDDCQ